MKRWKNGIFHTMVTAEEIHHLMMTHEGKIVGFDDDVIDMDYDEEIDLHGAHVYPGFVDAHLHLLGYGQMLSRILLHGMTKSEMLATLRKYGKNELLYAEGYQECGIAKHDLNQISMTTPIYIRHLDYHSLTVNDVVLKQMKIISDSGFLTETEAQQAIDLIPKHSKEQLELYLKDALNHLYQYGITGGHSDDLFYFNGFDETVHVFESVLKTMPFRAHLLMHHQTLKDYEQSGRPWLDQSPYLQLGAVKMFYDGTISSKTALMMYPYKGSKSNGIRVQDQETFIGLVKKARSLKLPVAVHVIGDLGLHELIQILKQYPPQSGLIDRLIHTPYFSKQTLLQLKGMPLSIDVQPQFLSSDLPWAFDRFSATPDLCFPWKSLLNHGIIISGSSDAPVEIPNPLLGMHAALFRTSDHDGKVYFPSETLTRFDAIKLYTTTSQIQTMDHHRGYLKQGYIADMTMMRRDLFTMDATEFKKDQTVMTVIDEKIVYMATHKS